MTGQLPDNAITARERDALAIARHGSACGDVTGPLVVQILIAAVERLAAAAPDIAAQATTTAATTGQPFTLVPNPPGVIGLHYTDTHLLACAECKATISDDVMAHEPDCKWLTVIAAQATTTERERIRQALMERQAVLAYVATERHVVAVLVKDIEYVLDGDTDGQ